MTPSPQARAREIGAHIFRWGLSCEDCTPEDFKIEMGKAVKQLEQFALDLRNETIEQIALLVEGETCSGKCECFSCPMLNAMATAIRSKAKGDL